MGKRKSALLTVGISLVVISSLIVVAAPHLGISLFRGDGDDNSPSASFVFDYDSDTNSTESIKCNYGSDGVLTITHDGGARIDPDQLTIVDVGSTNRWLEKNKKESWGDCLESQESALVGATHSVQLTVDADDTIRVVWNSEDGETYLMGEWKG